MLVSSKHFVQFLCRYSAVFSIITFFVIPASGWALDASSPNSTDLEWNVFLERWHVVGPFPKSTNKNYLDNESSPDITQSVQCEDKELSWREYNLPGINIDAFLDPERDINRSYAYAHTVVKSDRERDAVIAAGFDDSAKIWVNGEEVYNEQRTGGCTLDAFKIPIQLKQGDNVIVFRIDEGGGSWEMVARIIPAELDEPLLTVQCDVGRWHFIVRPPIISIELLGESGDLIEKHRCSGFRLNEGFTRFPLYASKPEIEPAQVRVTLEGDDYKPYQKTFSWDEAQEGSLPIVLEGHRTISGCVLGKDGKPVADARFILDLFYLDIRSDEEGQFQLENMEPTWCDFAALAEGYKGKTRAYNFSEIENLEIQLEPGGRVLKGVIQDEEGNPIEGASIRLSSSRPEAMDVTDSQGRFVLLGLREDRNSVYPMIEHPDFVPKGSFGQPLNEKGVTTATFILEKGGTVAGRITSKVDGKPIAGLQVTVGSDRFGSNVVNSNVNSDDEGHYVLKNVPVGNQIINVFSDNYAPETQSVTLGKGDRKEIDFEIDPGKDISGRITDENGEPLNDVWLITDTWEGQRMFRREARTDEDGKFTLSHMPDTPAIVHIMKQGYISNRDASMVGGENYDISLKTAFSITAEVLLSDTGKSPKELSVDRAYVWAGSSRISWNQDYRSRNWDPKKGSITFTFDEPIRAEKILLRFRSPGYKAETVEIPSSATESINKTIRLERAPEGMKGKIVSAETGEPVKDMIVVVVNRDYQLRMDHYSNLRSGRSALQRFSGVKTTTDERGEFQLDYIENFESSTIALLPPDEGFYLIDDLSQVIKDNRLLIEFPKLGKIVGRVTVGDKPVPNETLRISWTPAREREWEYPFGYGGQFSADGDGKFEIGGLPAGDYQIGRTRGFDHPGVGRTIMYMDYNKITLKESEEFTFNFERPEGVTLKGKTMISEDRPLGDCIITLNDGEGKQFDAVQSNENGEFVFKNAPEGMVTLDAKLRAFPQHPNLRRGEDAAQGRATVASDGSTEAIVMLKARNMEIQQMLTGMTGDLSGKKVPDFSGDYFGREDRFKLSEHKLKNLIVAFWSSENEESLAILPVLKQLFEKYESDDETFLATVCLDFEEDAVKKIVDEQELTFPIIFSGEGLFDGIFSLLGMKNIPSAVLIDAEGKFVGERLDGEGIKALLDR